MYIAWWHRFSARTGIRVRLVDVEYCAPDGGLVPGGYVVWDHVVSFRPLGMRHLRASLNPGKDG
jgi:hypothetical protein